MNMKNPVVTTVRQMEQMMSWILRKYVRHLVLGALSACAALNLALHAGAGLHYYCEEECIVKLLKGPLPSLDAEGVYHIRSNWLDPPAPWGTYKQTFPLDKPPWYSMGNWGETYTFINNFFDKYEKPGTFMEIGASDGEFKSLTLYVEQKLKFRGVLMEPNPETYQKLRKMGRAAYTINAGATTHAGHSQDELWIRDTPEDLPELLYRLQKGSNRLTKFVSVEDMDLGHTIPIQSFNAGGVALAALNSARIDLLVVSTHGGELEILQAIPKVIKITMLVIETTVVTQDDSDMLQAVTKPRNMLPVFIKGNFHIFVPRSYVAEDDHQVTKAS